MENQVYLYAFNHVEKIVDTKFLKGEAISIRNIMRLAQWMTDNSPEPIVIYAVDNRPGLHKEFLEAVKTNDFTKHVEFADTIRREGVLLSM